MRRPLVLAEPIRAFGHVIYGSKCLSRVSAYNFTARAFIPQISIHSAFYGFIPDRFMKILVICGGLVAAFRL